MDDEWANGRYDWLNEQGKPTGPFAEANPGKEGGLIGNELDNMAELDVHIGSMHELAVL